MSERTKYSFCSNPTILFNDLTDPNNWYRINEILFDTEVKNVEDLRVDVGIEDYTSKLGKGIGRMIISIFAENQGCLNELVANLKKAFNPKLTQENTSSDEGYLPLQFDYIIGATTYHVEANIKPLEIPKVVLSERGSGVTAAILFKMKDPRIYAQTAKTTTLTAAAASFTGTNDGNDSTYPSITINGPCTNPRITNTTSGEYIQIDDTLVGGDVYVINCKNATITKNGVNAYGYKNSGSKFFDIKSGAIVLTGSNLGTGNIQVSYKDAWII